MNSAFPLENVNKSDTTTRTVWGTGLIALDIVFDACTPHQRQYRAGGTCGNVLTILSYLGWNSYPIARLNGDASSLQIQDDFCRWGLNLEFVKLAPSAKTPTIVQRIEHDQHGATHSFLWQCPDCGVDLPRYKPIHISSARQLLPQLETRPPQVFFMDRVSPGALILAKSAKEKGALIVFEPSAVGEERLFAQALSLCDIVKYSHDRLKSLQTQGFENGPALEIKTLGSKGLDVRTRCGAELWNEWEHYPAFPVSEVVDSAGAGDWFTAGLLNALACNGAAGLSKVQPDVLDDAIRYGQALSAWCCGFEGPRGGMYAESRSRFETTVSEIADRQRWDINSSELTPFPARNGSEFPIWHCPHCEDIAP